MGHICADLELPRGVTGTLWPRVPVQGVPVGMWLSRGFERDPRGCQSWEHVPWLVTHSIPKAFFKFWTLLDIYIELILNE